MDRNFVHAIRARDGCASADAAYRVDATSGIHDAVEYVAGRHGRLFASLSCPGDDAGSGVLVCPSLFQDLLMGYRGDVLLARALAMHAVAVQRFHYLGMGNSDDSAVTPTLETMVGDALVMAGHLAATTGVSQLAFMGTRMGAVVAAAAARYHSGASVVFFEPVLAPKAFFREAFRAQRMHALAQSARGGVAPDDSMLDDLDRGGSAEVLGYRVTRELFESFASTSVVEQLGDSPRPILIVRRGRSELGPVERRAVEGWRSRGFEVDIHTLSGSVSWWFQDERTISVRDHIPVIQQWLVERLCAVP